MRTKTLLLAVAALAAGLATSSAQVFSQNIVGYANVPVPSGLSILCNPLQAGVSNGLNTEVISPSQLQDSYTFTFWTGTGYTSAQYFNNGDGLGNDWFDPNTFAVLPTPIVPPGQAWFVQNPLGSNYFTFVGAVTPSPGVTNQIPLPSGLSFIASELPIATPVTDSSMNMTLIDSITLLTWNGTAFDSAQYFNNGDGLGDNWFDPNTFAVLSTPTLKIGQGFFYQNPLASNYWTQYLTNSP